MTRSSVLVWTLAAAGVILGIFVWIWTRDTTGAVAPPTSATSALQAPQAVRTEVATVPVPSDAVASAPVLGADEARMPAPAVAQVAVSAGMTQIDVTGRTFYQDWTVLAGVRIDARLVIDRRPGVLDVVDEVRASCVSDAQGEFALKLELPTIADPERAWHVELHGSHAEADEHRIELPQAEFGWVERVPPRLRGSTNFQLPFKFALIGRCVDATSAKGVGGAELILIDPDSAFMFGSGTCTDDGSFELRCKVKPTVPTTLIARASGYLPTTRHELVFTKDEQEIGLVQLSAGQCISGTVVAAPGGERHAKWVDVSTRAEGAPLYMRDSQTGLVWSERMATLSRTRVPIGPNGEFSCCELHPGAHSLHLDYESTTLGSRSNQWSLSAPAQDVTLVDRLGVHDLHVSASDEAPLGEAIRVTVKDMPFELSYRAPGGTIVLDAGQELACTIRSDGCVDQALVLPPLAPGELRVTQVVLERRSNPAPPQCLVITGANADPILNSEFLIEGTDPSGQRTERRHFSNSQSSAHCLPSLDEGTYAVSVRDTSGNYFDGKWHCETRITVVVDGSAHEPIPVQLVNGGVVRITGVKGVEPGVYVRTFRVADTGESVVLDWRTIDQGGSGFGGGFPAASRVRLTNPLPPGTHTLRFESDGRAPCTSVVTIAAEKETELALEFGP